MIAVVRRSSPSRRCSQIMSLRYRKVRRVVAGTQRASARTQLPERRQRARPRAGATLRNRRRRVAPRRIRRRQRQAVAPAACARRQAAGRRQEAQEEKARLRVAAPAARRRRQSGRRAARARLGLASEPVRRRAAPARRPRRREWCGTAARSRAALPPARRPLRRAQHRRRLRRRRVAGPAATRRRSGASAVVRFDLAQGSTWLGRRRRAPRPRSVRRLRPRRGDGVAFAFTDGAALPDGSWVFSAVAEARDNSFDDGPCVASAIGVCDGDDALRFIETLAPKRKVEGIEAETRRCAAAAQRRDRCRRSRSAGRAGRCLVRIRHQRDD